MPENQEIISLNALRQTWSTKWGLPENSRIGRSILEKSLTYIEECKLSVSQETELKKLIKQYKRNPQYFDEHYILKPGTKIARRWKGKQHTVIVKMDGFEYESCFYPSLSKIANKITGSKWNGYLFFGLKKTP